MDTREIWQIAASASSEEDLLFEIAHWLSERVQSSQCDILLSDPEDNMVLRASTNSPEFVHRCRLGKGVGITGQAVISGKPVYVSRDVESHPLYVRYPGVDESPIQSACVLPMTFQGENLGVIFLVWETPRKFLSGFRKAMEAISKDCTLAYSTFRRAYNEGKHTNALGALSEVSRTIATSPYLEEILQLLVSLTAQQFHYVVCTVRLLDEQRGELVLRATQSKARAYQRKRAIRLGESIAGRAIAQRAPVIVPDVQIEADYVGHDLAVEQGLRSMLCVPLMLHGKPIGVISCYTSELHEFSEDEISALETLAQQAAASIEHAKLQVRTTLMQEMHHRVKNNLQQIASLLRLQMRHAGEKSVDKVLGDCLSRVIAISSVHDLLSREDLDHVGMIEVAEALVQHQQHSLILPDRTIDFQVRGDNVHLNTYQATQVALILNELIQNAVEHGFRNATKGEIHVTVEAPEETVCLWVSNSGDKLPLDFDFVTQSHLGLQIVVNLAKGLSGNFKLEDRLGWTVAEVVFPRITGE